MTNIFVPDGLCRVWKDRYAMIILTAFDDMVSVWYFHFHVMVVYLHRLICLVCLRLPYDVILIGFPFFTVKIREVSLNHFLLGLSSPVRPYAFERPLRIAAEVPFNIEIYFHLILRGPSSLWEPCSQLVVITLPVRCKQ